VGEVFWGWGLGVRDGEVVCTSGMRDRNGWGIVPRSQGRDLGHRLPVSGTQPK
jgi:hypothetical protein